MLWGSFRGSSRKSKSAGSFLHERLCYGAVPGGLAENQERIVTFLHKHVRYGAVPGGLAEKRKRIVVSA